MKVVFAGWLFAAIVAAQLEDARIGIVDFYALDGVDADRLRAAVSSRRGDPFTWPGTRDRLRDEVTKSAGRPFTQFVPVCCDSSGFWILYMGFGRDRSETNLRPRPEGDVQLPPELTRLYDEFMALLPASLKYSAGRPDDYSRGYSLSPYEPMQEVQLRMRASAVAHEQLLLRVLEDASDDKQRTAASLLAGYTRCSKHQIAALVDASRDANASVRNNATRSLGVLAATREFARMIPAEPFIDKLNSAVWSDRNKGLMLLDSLTRERNAKVLASIRARALPALIEMAKWQFVGHAGNAIRLLGRIAGVEESDLEVLAIAGDAAKVLTQLR